MIRALAATLVLVALASTTSAQVEPVSASIDTLGNGILEPGETARLVGVWRNTGVITFGGNSFLVDFTGPAGATYTIVDDVGSYIIPAGATVPCGDCYSVQVTAAPRPVLHWHVSMTESFLLIGASWQFHVGGTFDDVPATSPFYLPVENIVHKDVTSGCAPSLYCPGAPISREGMAVFLLVAMQPRGYVPPACFASPVFGDVPVSSAFCRWVEELARRGTVGGCGGGLFCPAASVTREEMAVFLLAGSVPLPPACSMAPFLDVPASSPFCRWIQELTRRGITAGCGNGNFCPADPVTREQMAAFLTSRFQLTIFTP